MASSVQAGSRVQASGYTQALDPRLAELVEKVAVMIRPMEREVMLWD